MDLPDSSSIRWSGLSPIPLLLVMAITCCLPLSVSAEFDYSQGWLGAPEWAIAWMNSGEFVVPDFLYPKNINATRVDEPTYVSYITNGNNLLSGGSFSEAKINYENAIGLVPNSSDAWLGRGYALEGLKRYQSALESYEKAIGFSKSGDYDWTAFAGKGRISLVLQNYKDAAIAFESAIHTFEGQEAVRSKDLISIYLGLAEAAQKSGDTEKSSAALEKAEELRSRYDFNSSGQSVS
jgi:tetratricopeptide (TPR) repeat protein